MASITLYTRNIMETGSVTVTGTADTGFPETRLYDRSITLFWKDTATGAYTFTVDQSATPKAIDALIIPKHNFDGEDLQWQWSTDNFSGSINDAVTDWTQSGYAQILKTIDPDLTKDYWRVTVSSMTDPMCSEIYMSYGHTFSIAAEPLPVRQPIPKIQWNQTFGGNERSTKFGDERRQRSYTLTMLDAAGLVNFRAAMDDLDGYRKPFFITDDEAETYMVRLNDIPSENPAEGTGTYARVSLNMIEVL